MLYKTAPRTIQRHLVQERAEGQDRRGGGHEDVFPLQLIKCIFKN